MKDITIYRDSWLRGEGALASFLLRKKDNKMCCLGQLGLQCGITATSMVNKSLYCEMSCKDLPEIILSSFMTYHPYTEALKELDAITAITRANDNGRVSEPTRESSISERLLALGFNVTFVDGYYPGFEPKENTNG